MASSFRVALFSAAESSQTTTFQQAVQQAPNLQVVGAAATWEELRSLWHALEPDVIIVNLDDTDGAARMAVERMVALVPGCSILGVSGQTDPTAIISAMRSGCTQFVVWPIDPNDLRDALIRIRTTRQVAQHTAKRFAVVGSSGGVGATTVACNLAMELGQLTGRRAALVDMNLEFGDIGCAFDCEPTYSIADVCREGVEVDRLLLSRAVHELPCNVSIITRPEQIELAHEITPEGVKNMFRILGDLYPYAVADLPRAFNAVTAAAVAEADRILVVLQLNVPCIRNATRIFQCLDHMGATEDRVEFVVNRYKASFERITPAEVEAHFGRPVFSLIPNDYHRVQKALDLGHPVMSNSPDSPARLAIQDMARRLTNDGPADPVAAPGSTGLLSKLWKRGAKAR